MKAVNFVFQRAAEQAASVTCRMLFCKALVPVSDLLMQLKPVFALLGLGAIFEV